MRLIKTFWAILRYLHFQKTVFLKLNKKLCIKTKSSKLSQNLNKNKINMDTNFVKFFAINRCLKYQKKLIFWDSIKTI